MALTSFPRAVCDLLFGLQPKEFFRPAQIDPYGNFNNIFMGGSYERPNLRLPVRRRPPRPHPPRRCRSRKQPTAGQRPAMVR